MKLGIIFQAGSVGAWRYLCSLTDGLLKQDRNLSVTLFHSESLANKIIDFGVSDRKRVHFQPLATERKYSKIRNVRLLQRKLDQVRGLTPDQINLRNYENCEVLFFPWPYDIPPPECSVPKVFIPHDFTYSRCFGTTQSAPSLGGFLWQKALHEQWLKHATCVVSAEYTKREIQRIFGDQYPIDVIPLSRFSPLGKLTDEEATSRLKQLSIAFKYVLCINNTCQHKNLGQLLSAFYLLKGRFPNVKLLLAGVETEGVCGISDSAMGLAFCKDKKRADVIGLGTVGDEDLVALIQQAEMVINPSLSEANNGPGLDAWDIGTPVAMSNIPPFQEHISFMGVHAELFNPRNSQDICDAMTRILCQPDKTKQLAEASRIKFRAYTWQTIAQQYLSIFERSIAKAQSR
jgi:glycosyltransferase involved in cell wall biosynthesis